ncbi:MAG: hypothetical protein AAF549_09350 [Pseudomonadota bacterium]
MTSSKTDSDIERDLYNEEIMGVNYSQNHKTKSSEDDLNSPKNKKKKEFAELSELAMRLQDAEYARLYYELGDNLSRLELLTDQAIAETEIDIKNQDHLIEAAMANATYLHNGTAVFKDGDKVHTLDGTEITDQDLLDSIVWKENSPSYTDIRILYDDLHTKADQLEELKRYRYETLGGARHEWEDENNPLSEEEIKKKQDHLLDQAPISIKEKLENQAVNAPVETTAGFQVLKPSL